MHNFFQKNISLIKYKYITCTQHLIYIILCSAALSHFYTLKPSLNKTRIVYKLNYLLSAFTKILRHLLW